jgi:hypothetical protein
MYDFDGSSANLWVELWNKDLTALSTMHGRFPDNEVKFEVLARVAGSSTQGATAGVDALIKGYFKIKLFYQDNVETCADNSITYADVSYYYPDESRNEDFYFYV